MCPELHCLTVSNEALNIVDVACVYLFRSQPFSNSSESVICKLSGRKELNGTWLSVTIGSSVITILIGKGSSPIYLRRARRLHIAVSVRGSVLVNEQG